MARARVLWRVGRLAMRPFEGWLVHVAARRIAEYKVIIAIS